MAHNELNRLRTVDLKKELQKQGLPTYGRKSLLIKRLEETLTINTDEENNSAAHVNKKKGPKRKTQNFKYFKTTG